MVIGHAQLLKPPSGNGRIIFFDSTHWLINPCRICCLRCQLYCPSILWAVISISLDWLFLLLEVPQLLELLLLLLASAPANDDAMADDDEGDVEE